MKNKFKLFGCALLALTIAGCSCSKEGVSSSINNPTSILSGDKTDTTLTTQDIYAYVRDNNSTTYNKIFMTSLVKRILEKESGYDSEELESTYEYKLEKYFKENFIDSKDYKVDGEFSEELLVAKLRGDLKKINDPINNGKGVTYDLGLTYDYSEYIASDVDYDIYMELLKEDYISHNKKSILDKSKSRIITVYSLEDLEDMEEIVADLFDGKYESLEDLEKTKKDEQKLELGRQYCENLGLKNEYYKDENGEIIETCTPTKSSYDTTYSKFTTCKDGKKCSLKDGLKYQIDLVDETEYLKEQVINKNSENVLFENAFNLLQRDNIEDYLLSDTKMNSIFTKDALANGNFLMTNTLNGNVFDEKSIILSSGPDATCYIVLVKVVDSNTPNTEEGIKDKQQALELLLSNVSETSVLLHYVEKMDIELIDADLKEAYKGIID